MAEAQARKRLVGYAVQLAQVCLIGDQFDYAIERELSGRRDLLHHWSDRDVELEVLPFSKAELEGIRMDNAGEPRLGHAEVVGDVAELARRVDEQEVEDGLVLYRHRLDAGGPRLIPLATTPRCSPTLSSPAWSDPGQAAGLYTLSGGGRGRRGGMVARIGWILVPFSILAWTPEGTIK